MKAMTEIVNSIKNEKLKAVALELQAKLENARDAIVQKRNSGEKVTRAESSALKTSTLGYVKKGLSVALVTAMLTTMLASCDEFGSEINGTGTGNQSSVVETLAEGETVPYYESILPSEFGLDTVFKEFDIPNLYYGTEGHEVIEEWYPQFLDALEGASDYMTVNYDAINYFYHLMSGSEDRRRNVAMELTDPSKDSAWSHTLVSTTDDFALVSRYKSKYYITGFVDGKLYDDAYTMGSEAFNTMQAEIQKNGYESVLNTVRDEFFGIMYIYKIEENEDFSLGYNGREENVYNEDRTVVNPPTEWIYTMDEIIIYSQKTKKKVATITPTYDIPDNYIDQFIENKNYAGNHGRPQGNNNHWQNGEFVPGQDGANND